MRLVSGFLSLYFSALHWSSSITKGPAALWKEDNLEWTATHLHNRRSKQDRCFEKILESLHRNRFLLLEAAFYPCFSIDLKENFHLSALIFTSQRAGTATLRIKASHSLFTLWAVLLLPRSWPSSKHRISLLRNVYRSINQIDYKHK